MAKKSVCIVGGGPGAIVSAKVLLQAGGFDITIFEKTSRIGGIWALDKDSKDGFLSPYTPTNLSRYQVAFSDLSWNSVDLGSDSNHIPMFPKAWQVNQYLETYRRKHIPDHIIHLNTTVVSVARNKDATWTVTTRKSTQEDEQSL